MRKSNFAISVGEINWVNGGEARLRGTQMTPISVRSTQWFFIDDIRWRGEKSYPSLLNRKNMQIEARRAIDSALVEALLCLRIKSGKTNCWTRSVEVSRKVSHLSTHGELSLRSVSLSLILMPRLMKFIMSRAFSFLFQWKEYTRTINKNFLRFQFMQGCACSNNSGTSSCSFNVYK